GFQAPCPVRGEVVLRALELRGERRYRLGSEAAGVDEGADPAPFEERADLARLGGEGGQPLGQGGQGLPGAEAPGGRAREKTANGGSVHCLESQGTVPPVYPAWLESPTTEGSWTPIGSRSAPSAPPWPSSPAPSAPTACPAAWMLITLVSGR